MALPFSIHTCSNWMTPTRKREGISKMLPLWAYQLWDRKIQFYETFHSFHPFSACKIPFLFWLQKMKQQLIPHVRHTWKAPVDAVRVTRWVWQLSWTQRLPELPVYRWVPIFPVLRELSDVQNHNFGSQVGQNILHHLHRWQVRAASPVTFLVYGKLLAVTVAFTLRLPLLAPKVHGWID